MYPTFHLPPPTCLTPPPSSPYPKDTLSSFNNFCKIAQASLTQQTTTFDGLATFFPTPPHYPPPTPSHPNTQSISGSLLFHTAQISTSLHPTSPASNTGLSLKLLPRNPHHPTLRFHCRYFQLLSPPPFPPVWWFDVSADLLAGPFSPSHIFTSRYATPFQTAWHSTLASSHSLSHQAFLHRCLDHPSTPIVQPPLRMDRDFAFGFVAAAVDRLLPAYLPLLVAPPRNKQFQTPVQQKAFLIRGGARCETDVWTRGPLASARFCVVPSGKTAAGRAYRMLRERPGRAAGGV